MTEELAAAPSENAPRLSRPLLSCDPPRFVRMTADEYHADPCETPSLSSSIARKIVSESPRHAYSAHPRLGGVYKKPTPAMDSGSIMHALLLDGGKGIVECHYDNFKTKSAQVDRDQAYADGKTPVIASDLAEARRVAAILKGKLAALGMVFDGETEIVALWTELATDGTPVPCRAMLDHFSLERAMVDDLKTAASAEPEKINRSGGDNGYDIQAAAYARAVQKIKPELIGRVQVSFGFCELKDPYATTVVERGRGGNFYELGEMRWQRGIDTFARCMKSGVWPEYVTGRIRADVPPWMMQRELDLQAFAEAARIEHSIRQPAQLVAPAERTPVDEEDLF